MAVTLLGEVPSSSLATAPQPVFLATPQAAEPATAASAQVYAKTDKNLYHKDTAGTVTNLLASAQLASNAIAGITTVYPYGSYNATGPVLLQSGASQNIYKGFIATAAGSVVGATWMGAAPSATTGSVQVYKNGSLFFTAIAAANFLGNSATSGPVTATFAAGAYPFVKGDYFDVYYTGSGSSLYMGVGITFVQGNAYANALSTVVAANTTIAPTDNQRTWVGSASTAYTLTLPATQAAQDFFIRAAVVGGAGLVIQAPAGVTIYKGASASSAGGSLTLTAVGTYVALYNPAGQNMWLVTDPSAPGTLA